MSELFSWNRWQELPRISGIYRIVHLTTGREYIGSAKDIRFRIGKHRRDLLNGKHHSPFLQRIFRKYGYNSVAFELIEQVSDASQLVMREQFHIDERQPALNVCPTAGSCLGVKHTPETRKKRSAATKKRWEQLTELEKWAFGARMKAQGHAQWERLSPEERADHSERAKRQLLAQLAGMSTEEMMEFRAKMRENAGKASKNRGEYSAEARARIKAGQDKWRTENPEAFQATVDRMRLTKRAKGKVNAENVAIIRQRSADGIPYSAIGAEFGLSISSISNIVTRKTWGDV